MAISDGINPSVEGIIEARGFKTKSRTTGTKGIPTTGTDEADIFPHPNGFNGSAIGFNGSVTAIRVLSTDATAAEILVYAGTPKGTPFSRYLVGKVKKDAGATNSFTGSMITASGAFTANGSLVAVSSSAGNAYVEVTFTSYIS